MTPLHLDKKCRAAKRWIPSKLNCPGYALPKNPKKLRALAGSLKALVATSSFRLLQDLRLDLPHEVCQAFLAASPVVGLADLPWPLAGSR